MNLNCNMEKINDKWLKEHGWVKVDTTDVDESGTKRHSTKYYMAKDKLYAKIERVVETYQERRFRSTKSSVSRYYMFWAWGNNGFTVENRITHFNFNQDTVIAALRTVGFDEFGNKLDK